jgi:hypothetical protein
MKTINAVYVGGTFPIAFLKLEERNDLSKFHFENKTLHGTLVKEEEINEADMGQKGSSVVLEQAYYDSEFEFDLKWEQK